MGGDLLDSGKDRLLWRDAAQVGAARGARRRGPGRSERPKLRT